ncbi:restriction endonuclease subunit S [Amycolatopsis sp. NPDC051373]|uniref:restriction endonuclease subunit S n=1 Tax=Amycolatopsis sp. NPDC051373 TaxID=3155801 RepID=UPI00344C6CB2
MSDWRQVSLSEVVTRVTTKNVDGANENVLTVSAGHGLIAQESFFTRKIASKDTSGYYVVSPGQFVYNKSTSKSAAYGTVARNLSDEPGVVSPLYFVFEAKAGAALPEYLELALNSDQFFGSLAGTLREGARTHGLLNVRLKEFYAATVTLPPVPLQERIAEVIGSVDDQITALDTEADASDALLAGRKEELFAHYGTTGTTLQIGEILEEIKRPIIVAPDAEYRQIGIRSHGRGLFTKEAVTGESLGSKKVFWIEPGDLVINIVFAWEGAVAIVPPEIEGYCGSHRFPAYRRLDGGDVEFFRLFFSTKTGTRLLASCSPGGAGRNRTLNRKRLMQSRVGIPSAQEQERAICELQAMEAAVMTVHAEADRLRSVRTALLSGLLDRTIEIESAELEV